jgi:hypothetical protein
MDLGAPSSYMALADGTDVISSDGERIGEVEHVLADAEVDIFDGLVIDSSSAPGGHRFVDASKVDEVYERGVVLTIAASAVDELPEPSENPAVMSAGPDAVEPDDLGDKLRRAWERITGQG